jgi:hypothetical protein
MQAIQTWFIDNSNIIALLFVIILLILSIYNRIKYLCLEKACEKIAAVEKMDNLSGEEKFALVISWINKDLPKLFANTFFKSILEKIVQFAYDNSFKYMKNYIKRKTGYDISSLIDQINTNNKDDNSNKDQNTSSNK